MALFGLGKNKTDAKPAPEAKQEVRKDAVTAKEPARVVHAGGGEADNVLRNPRITEKATMHSEAGVYTFDVSESATKRSISEAVASIYSVTPRMVRIVRIPTKTRRNMRTGKSGVSGGGKKAYVYLKEGDTITIS